MNVNVIKPETLQTITEIAKFYYMDVVIMFLMFLCGIGIGIALNEAMNQWLKKP